MEFLLQLLVAFAWFYLGWKARGWYIVYSVHRAVVKELSDEHGVDLVKLDKIPTDIIEDVLFLNVEKHDDLVLVYDRATDEFVCQGTSVDDAAVQFNQRKPKTLGTFKIDEKQMYFFEGKLTYDMPEAQ